ncbi:Peptidyl-prolyl isomerase cwc27, variant 2 [Chamberlinius hualienensis]
MSNIYIQEPPTDGKVLLETSVGDIDVELWSKETPKACRNFIQLCMDGYYNGTIFHRVIRGFIAQGGDPTGTGMGGESIYGEPFKDEFHTRLRFVRRGLVAMANAGKDDNSSQFFFTLGSCPELQNKHTIFGKVAGDTLYNMIRLEESLDTDSNDRPKYPHKIIKTRVISNPFTDIVPRNLIQDGSISNKKEKSKQKKNFKLLSFGDEAEEDDDATDTLSKDSRGKSKSSHDLANDPKLSSVPAVEQKDSKKDDNGEEEIKEKNEEMTEEEEKQAEKAASRLAAVQQKLKGKVASQEQRPSKREFPESDDENDGMSAKKKAQVEEIRKEIRKIKRELKPKPEVQEVVEEEPTEVDSAIQEYEESLKVFKDKKQLLQSSKESNEERVCKSITLLTFGIQSKNYSLYKIKT